MLKTSNKAEKAMMRRENALRIMKEKTAMLMYDLADQLPHLQDQEKELIKDTFGMFNNTLNTLK
jgi:hypothetical protein